MLWNVSVQLGTCAPPKHMLLEGACVTCVLLCHLAHLAKLEYSQDSRLCLQKQARQATPDSMMRSMRSESTHVLGEPSSMRRCTQYMLAAAYATMIRSQGCACIVE